MYMKCTDFMNKKQYSPSVKADWDFPKALV